MRHKFLAWSIPQTGILNMVCINHVVKHQAHSWTNDFYSDHYSSITIDQSHKSYNAPTWYLTMRHSEQKRAHFCFEWDIGGIWDKHPMGFINHISSKTLPHVKLKTVIAWNLARRNSTGWISPMPHWRHQVSTPFWGPISRNFEVNTTALWNWNTWVSFRYWYIDGFVQYCSNSIANTLELLPSCTKPSKHAVAILLYMFIVVVKIDVPHICNQTEHHYSLYPLIT